MRATFTSESLIAAEIKTYERTISHNLDSKSWYQSMAHRCDLEIEKAERAINDLRAAYDAIQTLR